MIETGLNGKVVIVTCAAAGIGRGTAERFAEEGCKVAAWDIIDDGADELVAMLESLGGEAIFRKNAGPLLPGAEHVPPPDPAHCPFC